MVKKEARLCSECKTQTEWQNISLDFERRGIKVRVSGILAEVCPKCGEQYIPGETAGQMWKAVDQILKAAEQSREEAPSLHEYKVTVA